MVQSELCIEFLLFIRFKKKIQNSKISLINNIYIYLKKTKFSINLWVIIILYDQSTLHEKLSQHYFFMKIENYQITR